MKPTDITFVILNEEANTYFYDHIYGVYMGDGFLDALHAPLPMKEVAIEGSRLKHGKEVTFDEKHRKKDSRDLTLSFVIVSDADSIQEARNQLYERRQKLYAKFYQLKMIITLPDMPDRFYHLLYTGKSMQHSMNATRTSCTITAKFTELDPTKLTMGTAVYSEPSVGGGDK